jgi:aspartyl/asparaginyl beta-hydroxylase (cupin superfamily)/Tfp pilus assembly protein PilF
MSSETAANLSVSPNRPNKTSMIIEDLMQRAGEARRGGRNSDAKALFEKVVAARPDHAGALNSLGLIALDVGDTAGAVDYLQRAAAADPVAPSIWLNLAMAQRAIGATNAELTSLDRALDIDPYLLPALVRKAQAFERLSRTEDAAEVYRIVTEAATGRNDLPEALVAALAHGRELLDQVSRKRADAMAAPLAAVRASHPSADFTRAQGYADHRAGQRRVYQQQPTGSHFPYLPAIEFFEPRLMPWLPTLERSTNDIKRELLSLWSDNDAGFAPYVSIDRAQPVNQWAELNHSARWSAWFFDKNGIRQEDNRARCPATSAVLDALPLLDVPGKGPTAMFSTLAPRTRIPPHTGTSNVRATVHLPLIVPDGCGFRVGSQTRDWEVGHAWAFDDTIEHEAWNDSDQPRVILIIDAWNPFLTEAERAVVRAIG